MFYANMYKTVRDSAFYYATIKWYLYANVPSKLCFKVTEQVTFNLFLDLCTKVKNQGYSVSIARS